MKVSRRQSLAERISVGEGVSLLAPIAQTTTSQVNTASKQMLEDPWYFEVDEFDTIVDPSIEEPKIRREVFEIDTSSRCTVESLISDIEGCVPLTTYFQQLTADELDKIQTSLKGSNLSSIDRKSLTKIADALGDQEDGWSAWIRLEGAAGLTRFKAAAQKWLDSPIEWDDYEWFPKYATSQGSAMKFFESLPTDTLAALGVVIIEGDHPGSTYYAAELKTTIEAANSAAAFLELPFRFQEG